ncbi:MULTISPECIES: CCA tRNA nucleotidyltransferase [Thermoanaerobacterium]|uniref:tRNA nucleotidyltransferase/poly(A) polymerase n=3 Tax=Thermoanaerobacterium TaxID=28895 RepID=L0INH6_THETR|nr:MULTISPECIES: polynucleotide adenylyltransferase region [Thermoanaerobacterium]AFK94238.1 Polynucleotide adenylyltransferase region [Thermoanaerobacterium saccharolyticum JW/SL-YS485]AGB20413.1 tRNA nucleotidyltransferase/poly(A) polymerase [Thermoanaerobacterium thermosaccharolyticum M0795]ETO39148.1 Polynucleotide adenylyltransferase region [Thermoanaerobacterium aotearoense SCUT27]
MFKILEKILSAGGQLYRVGGSVRDEIMGFEPHDFDYCVTGLSIEQFTELFPNAQVTGKDFPVFRINNEEYALARTEKKQGTGYRGFEVFTSPNVTIEQDLARRDLTINSIAINVATGKIVDPFGGIEDINKGVIRATTPAFAEDPLRVYRAARFAAKFNFKVEPKTIKMMNSLKNELNTLSVERVFEEVRKALNTEKPSLFFSTLLTANVLDVHFKELLTRSKNYNLETALKHIDKVSKLTTREEVKFAALVQGLDSFFIQNLCYRLNLPKTWLKAGLECSLEHSLIDELLFFDKLSSFEKVNLLEKISKSTLGFDGLSSLINKDISKIKSIADSMFKNVSGNALKEIIKKNKLNGAEISRLIHNERVKFIEFIL